MKNVPAKKSPLTFFLFVYGLSIPFWVIETMIDVKGLPLDIPITDILAAFAPLVAASVLFHTILNIGRPLFLADSTHNPLVDYPAIHYSVLAIAADIVIFLWRPKTLAQYRYA